MTPLESYEPGTDIRPFLHKISQPPKKESSHQGGVKVHKKDYDKKYINMKKAVAAHRKIALEKGNELREYRMKKGVNINDLSKQLGCAGKTIVKAETTTGVLTQKQVYKLQPFYGDLVHCFLTVKGDEWKTVQK